MSTLFPIDAQRYPALASLLEQAEATQDNQPTVLASLLNQALPMVQAVGDPALLSAVSHRLGFANTALQNIAALRNFETALEAAERAARVDLKVNALYGLASSFLNFGEVQTSLEYCDKALSLARQFELNDKIPRMLITLGVVLQCTQQYDHGLEVELEAAEASEALGDRATQAHALNNAADMLVSEVIHRTAPEDERRRRLLGTAIGYGRQALQLAETFGVIRTMLLATETLAHALELSGEYVEAMQHVERTLVRASGAGFAMPEIDLQQRKGSLLIGLGRVDDAIASLKAARETALQLTNYPHFDDLLRSLSSAQERQGDFAGALASYKEFHAALMKQRDRRAEISAQIYAAKMDLAKAQLEVERQRSRVDQLEGFNRSLKVQANQDPLTGVPNRRALEEAVDSRTSVEAPDLVFVMADIDFFKKVNDNFSHLIGDEVLRQVAGLLKDCLRDRDMLARIGGEEFSIILDRCKADRVVDACNRLRRQIEAFDWSQVASGLKVTMSFGATRYRAGDSLKSMMTRADEGLYRAKENGRNRVEEV